MRLHVVTAVTRSENIGRIAASLAEAQRRAPDVNVTWWMKLDQERKHVGGQRIKNEILSSIKDGWVWVLDDDTTVHEDLFRVVSANRNHDAVVVSQDRPDMGAVLVASRENIRVSGIDIGQAVIRREVIGDARIPETYDGDGSFLQEVLAEANVAFVEESLSLYNSLRA